MKRDLPRRAQRAQRSEKRRGEEQEEKEEEGVTAGRSGRSGAAPVHDRRGARGEFGVGVVTLCELPGHEPRGERGNPGDGQQRVDQCAEKIIGQSEGDRWDVPVGLFQVNLISFTSHGVPVGYNIY